MRMTFAGAIAISVTTSLATMSASAMTNDEARRAISEFNESFVKAEKAGDAAAVAHHFTKDSIRVGPRGITDGFDTISRNYSDIYKVFRETEDTIEVVKAIDDCAILVSGKWSGVLRGTAEVHGYYSFLAVCDGPVWKIKADIYNYSPDGMPSVQPKQ